jgi:hypothetical protein
MKGKLCITLLAIIIPFITFSQITRPCSIFFKSGEVVSEMRGTYNNKHFKYYKKVGDRYNKVKIELLDSVLLTEKSGSITKLRFLPVTGEKKIQVVEQLLIGKLELYQQINYNQHNSYYQYFIRKHSQEKLTKIETSRFGSNKEKTILFPFIEDCPELIEKIENDVYKVISDMIIIIGTYNITCGLNKN